MDRAKVEAAAERDRIIAAAKAEAQQEYQAAREQLRNQVADLAVAGAAKILQREIDPRAHAELLDSIRREL
jgi:F-type H+-transporting ATPase subunit b